MSFQFIPGVVGSLPDHRDYIYGQLVAAPALPPMFYLLRLSVRDQGSWGTCVGQAAAGIKDRQEYLNYPSRGLRLSPLFIYTSCKQRDNIPNQQGTYPRVAMAVLKELGACQEKTMPYNLMANPLPGIPPNAFMDAAQFKIGAYAKVQTLTEIKTAIQRDGPVMGAVIVCQNFVDAEGGYIELPNGKVLGGHAILLDGWDDNLVHGKYKGYFRFANSWGEAWGDRGYGYLPYEFVTARDEIGAPYFMEAWSSVDVILPPEPAKEVVLWIDKTLAVVDGNEVQLDQPPVFNATTGRTLVPLRFLSEILNYKVIYDGIERKITLTR